MRFFYGLIVAMLVTFGTPSLAHGDHARCSAEQMKILDDAFRGAKDITVRAAGHIGDTAEYQRWFGSYSKLNAEKVRASLKSVVTALQSGAVTAQCERVATGGCEADEYAWVYTDEPYLIHICPSYFTLPSLANLRPGTRASNNGTREGTIIHEVSHFLVVAETDDHCYSRSECSRMAQRDAARAIENADSYQYYAEDIAYFARQRPEGKPPVIEHD